MPTVCGGTGGAGIGGTMAVGATGPAAQTGIGGIMPTGTTTMTVPIVADCFARLPTAQLQQQQQPAAPVTLLFAFALQQSLHLQPPSRLQPSLQHLQPSLQEHFVSAQHLASLQQSWHAPFACSLTQKICGEPGISAHHRLQQDQVRDDR